MVPTVTLHTVMIAFVVICFRELFGVDLKTILVTSMIFKLNGTKSVEHMIIILCFVVNEYLHIHASIIFFFFSFLHQLKPLMCKF